MKSKRRTSVKPRNRESKNYSSHISQAEEYRHLWVNGVCVKCGCSQTDISSPDSNANKSV